MSNPDAPGSRPAVFATNLPASTYLIVPVDICQRDAAGDLVERGSHTQNCLSILLGSRLTSRAKYLKQLRRGSLRKEVLVYKV